MLVPCIEGDLGPGGPGGAVWPSEGKVTWGVPGPAIERIYILHKNSSLLLILLVLELSVITNQSER